MVSPAGFRAASSCAVRFSYVLRDQRPENRNAATVSAGTRRVRTAESNGAGRSPALTSAGITKPTT